MTAHSIKLMAILAAAATATAGCGNRPTGRAYNPRIPTNWASAVTNPFFPLVPGTIDEFKGQTDAGLETITVEVLSGTKLVNGVAATVVRDRVHLDGKLLEDTFDWYAQDGDGNVWYLGEDSKESENGQVVSTEGHVGEQYRQEFFEGKAEDWGKVVAVNESVGVPYGSFTGCIRTEDWNALESGSRENKYYCPQVGIALEVVAGGWGACRARQEDDALVTYEA